MGPREQQVVVAQEQALLPASPRQGIRRQEISEITAWQIEKWKKERKEMQSRRKKPIRTYGVNRELATLKHPFGKPVEWNRLKENPAKKIKWLKGEEKRVRFLRQEEIQTLLGNCSDSLRPVVEVALNTGMRRGEIFGLTWDCVNFEHGILTLLDTKNNKRHDVPMNKTGNRSLRE